MIPHQFIDRRDQRPVDERFCGDPLVSLLYSRVRENSAWMYRMLTSARLTRLLALLRFDLRPPNPAVMRRRMTRQLGIDLTECVEPPETIDTPRKVFERQIRYWDCRPMEADPRAVVSPADARLLVGSLRQTSALFLKDKFFDCDELFGVDKTGWREAFRNGDYAVLRLTPEKYHYLHLPVTGMVRDIYEIDGVFQSCHPAVVIAQATPHSKNRRTTTIIDTQTTGGAQLGLVAMIEIVALMIGDIVQCYSRERYDHAEPLRPGMPVERGCPKSLFRPGSSTVVLIFQQGRVRFCDDILANLRRPEATSRYTLAWGVPLVETEVAVRSTIALALHRGRR